MDKQSKRNWFAVIENGPKILVANIWRSSLGRLKNKNIVLVTYR
jgi:hypothetical protein